MNLVWTFWKEAFRHISGYKTLAQSPPGDWLLATGVNVIGYVVFSSTSVPGLIWCVGPHGQCSFSPHLFHLFTLDLPPSLGPPVPPATPHSKQPCPEWLLSFLTQTHLCLGGASKRYTWFSPSVKCWLQHLAKVPFPLSRKGQREKRSEETRTFLCETEKTSCSTLALINIKLFLWWHF